MNPYGQVTSLVWLSLAIAICIESIRLPLGSWQNPGAGFLPLGSGLILGFLSIIDYLQSRRAKSQEIEESWYSKGKLKNVFLVLATLVGYAVLLEYLGFLLSTFLLLAILFKAVEPQRWAVALGGSVAASITTYVIFELLLRGQLPKGLLGF